MNSNSKVLVSVVIPSRFRPQLVSRAIASVLAQTLQDIEVLVVVDGPDESTVRALSHIPDPRLKVIILPTNGGPSQARNIGVQRAQGEWIAFLDDDDEWLPQKLELQLEMGMRSPHHFPVVVSRFIAHTSKGEQIWPRRLPSPDEPLSEYLFVRNSLFLGEGFIQTSTFFAPKALLTQVPLGNALNRHEDWDWLLHVNAMPGVGIEFVSEPMAIWYSDIGRQRLSNIQDWKYSLNWIRSVQDLVTPRAYAGFIMTVVSAQAALQRDWPNFYPLLREAMQHGQPRPLEFLLYFGMWLVPQEFRQQMRSRLTQRQRALQAS